MDKVAIVTDSPGSIPECILAALLMTAETLPATASPARQECVSTQQKSETETMKQASGLR